MAPHIVPPIPKAIVAALKALSEGVANDGQQKSALEWILFEACGIRNVSYQPGDTAATAFAEGRRFAGLIIAGAMQAKPVVSARPKRNQRQEANND